MPVSPVSLRRARVAPDQLAPGSVLVDQLRERTAWFEGLFVTATHFNRDQSYLLARQADLGRAIGKGVIEGLTVRIAPDDPTAVIVAPGFGIGGGGESIVLHAPTRIALGDLPLQRQLTAAAGLDQSLKLIAETRTGLFVLAATPVEYGSNRVGAYPTSPAGDRRLEDSVINEAVMFTLVPYTLAGSALTEDARRARAAKQIFGDGREPELPATSLPLAMVELDGNLLVWLDPDLVRRDAGAARADAFGIGLVDTPRRIAHFRQYDAMITAQVAANPGEGFAAAGRFALLPAMGRMPAACVRQRAPAPGLAPVLSHNWLPSSMPVELVALPDDEIDQLLEESLTLPAIDLEGPPEVLGQTPVSVIVPVPRADWATTPLEVQEQSLTLQPAAPLGGTAQNPLDLIQSLIAQDLDPAVIEPAVTAEWLAVLAGRSTLWYARRRQFPRTDALIGTASPFVLPAPPEPGEPPEPENPPIDFGDLVRPARERLLERLGPLGLAPQFERLAIETPEAAYGLVHLAHAVLDSGTPLAVNGLLAAAAGAPVTVASADALHQTYAVARVGERLRPFEGLLTGGPVMIEVPGLADPGAAPAIRETLSRALNARVPVVSVPLEPDLPADFPERLTKLLDALEIPEAERKALFAYDRVRVPLGDPRDLEEIRRVLQFLIELGLPARIRPADAGSAETQTRRNLAARTEALPKLADALGAMERARAYEGGLKVAEGMNGAVTQTAVAGAISAAKDAMAALL